MFAGIGNFGASPKPAFSASKEARRLRSAVSSASSSDRPRDSSSAAAYALTVRARLSASFSISERLSFQRWARRSSRLVHDGRP